MHLLLQRNLVMAIFHEINLIRSALWVVVSLFMCSKAHALVYRDYAEFSPDETLHYGILDINSNPEVLQFVNRNEYKFPNFNLYYIRSPKYFFSLLKESWWQTFQTFLSNKDIFFEITEYRYDILQTIAECFQNTTAYVSSNDTRYAILFDYPVNRSYAAKYIPLIKRLQIMGIKIGIFMPTKLLKSNVEEAMQYYQSVDIKINMIVADFYLDDYDEIYDYNGFIKYFGGKIQTLNDIMTIPSKDFRVIIKVKGILFTHISSSVHYGTLIAKFLYRWGELNKQLVIFEHDSNLKMTYLYSSLNKMFRSPSDAQLIVSLKTYDKTDINSISNLEAYLICADFNVFYLEYHDNQILNLTKMSDLALSHSQFPCVISWIVELKLNDSFHGISKNLETLFAVNKTFPGIVRMVLVSTKQCDSSHFRLSAIDSLREMMSTAKTRLQEFSEKFNMSAELAECAQLKYLYSPMKLEIYSSKIPSHYVNVSSYILGQLEFTSRAREDFSKILQTIGVNLEAHRQTLHRNTSVFVRFTWKSSSWFETIGCFDFKKKWNTIRNWAAIHSYIIIHDEKLFLDSSVHGNTSDQFFIKAWFKPTDNLGERFPVAKSAHVASNFQDKCVELPLKTPDKPVNISQANAGVTFTLLEDNYVHPQLTNDDMAMLLKLIHTKFKAIEIILNRNSLTKTLKIVISSVRNDKDSTSYQNYKYFVNILNEPLVGIKQFSNLIEDDTYFGVHANYCGCENDFRFLRHKSFSKRKYYGVSVSFEETSKLLGSETGIELVAKVDYLVIRINLVDTMIVPVLHKANWSNVFYYYVSYFPHDILPNQVFGSLRFLRIEFRRISPNITVYLQLAWPTINTTKSARRTQQMLEFLNDFSTEFDFPFFLYEAFDHKGGFQINVQHDLTYGWWRLMNNANFHDPFSYIDRQAEYYNLETERPKYDRKSTTMAPSFMPTTEVVIGIVTLFVGVLVVAAVVIQKLRGRPHNMLSNEELQKFELGALDSSANHECNEYYSDIAYDKKKYEIGKAEFDFGTRLGEGQFGVVYQTVIPKFDKTVAVKVPKIRGKDQLLSVLGEIKVMSYVGKHENIIFLLGAYTRELQKGVIYIVTEFLQNGSLLEYLRKEREVGLTSTQKLYEFYQFCFEISNGMNFLNFKKVIHGDLSTRNVLLDEYNTCKICDFGLSRKLYDMDLYVKTSAEPIPWKWMALETLERSELSLKSDIWSLGVTIWEVFSLGIEPYPGLSWDTEFVTKLKAGICLPKPNIMDGVIYEEIKSCWELQPDKRPSAEDIMKLFQDLKDSTYTNLL